MKICAKCETSKPLNQYHNNAAMPDGLHFYCKPCHRGYAANRRNTARDMLAAERNVAGFVEKLSSALSAQSVTAYDLARQIGVKPDTIRSWLKGEKKPHPRTQAAIANAMGIELNALAFKQDDAGRYPDGMGECPVCETRFPTYNKCFRVHCSDECATRAQSTRQFGEENPAYSGGRKMTDQGYVQILVGRDSPMAGRGGYVLEHRQVMSEVIGRPLKRSERVHHKNGKRDDNRPENLELWVPTENRKEHPNGVRLRDKVIDMLDSLKQDELQKVIEKAQSMIKAQE